MGKVTQCKILYGHQIFQKQRYGGISRYFCELASRLSQNEACDVSIIAPFHENRYLNSVENCSVIGNYFPYRFSGANFVREWGSELGCRFLYWTKNKADIVHDTYYSLKAWGNARYRIVTVADMIHELFPEDFEENQYTTNVKRAAVLRADHVICISEATRQDLIRLFQVDERKTSVVHLGFTLNIHQNVNSAKLASGRPYLLHVGDRWGYKNFPRLCRVFASSSFKNDFDLVAFGKDAFSADEVAQFTQLGIADLVHQVSGDDGLLASYYQGATALVYPSLYEGFGLPPLEAMNFGCPVVCSNTSSIPEVVGDAAELFSPEDEEDMLRAIEKVVTSPERTADLIERGRTRCKQFSWDKCATDTFNAYQKLLQQ